MNDNIRTGLLINIDTFKQKSDKLKSILYTYNTLLLLSSKIKQIYSNTYVYFNTIKLNIYMLNNAF